MATSFLHVDFQQPAEMRFNRARVRRAFVTIGQRHMRDARRLVIAPCAVGTG
ncbi:prophage protein [Escherichia coli]|nr:prophage protein [Escherichia coli]